MLAELCLLCSLLNSHPKIVQPQKEITTASISLPQKVARLEAEEPQDNRPGSNRGWAGYTNPEPACLYPDESATD